MDMVLIGGLPGVGKTTVINNLLKGGYQQMCFGSKMIRLAEKKGILKNARWKMHDLPRKQIIRLENLVVDEMLKSKGLVLLESHLIIVTEHGIRNGFPKRIYQKLPIKKIILLEAEDYEIIKRRVKSRGNRSKLPRYKFSIDKHQFLNRQKAKRLSKLLNIPYFIIYNQQGKLSRTLELVKKLL